MGIPGAPGRVALLPPPERPRVAWSVTMNEDMPRAEEYRVVKYNVILTNIGGYLWFDSIGHMDKNCWILFLSSLYLVRGIWDFRSWHAWMKHLRPELKIYPFILDMENLNSFLVDQNFPLLISDKILW